MVETQPAQQQNILSFLPNKSQIHTPSDVIKDPLTPTIFHEPWWLNIVTGGNYECVEVRERGEVVGRLPYVLRNVWGLKYGALPHMTHFLGPAVIEGEGSYSTRFLRRSQIIRELVAQLPAAAMYKFKCHRGITDAIAFQQEKFFTSVQFTHEILPDTEEALWKNLRTEKRKKIRQAQKLHQLVNVSDPEEFWHFYNGNVSKRGVKNIYNRQMLCKIIESVIARGCGRIFGARTQQGDLVGTVFSIWDATSAFDFMSSRAPSSHNGVISLLTWEAIKDAAQRGLIFDFDGLAGAKSVLFFTEFGGTVSPRYIVTRRNFMGAVAIAMKDIFRESKYFY